MHSVAQLVTCKTFISNNPYYLRRQSVFQIRRIGMAITPEGGTGNAMSNQTSTVSVDRVTKSFGDFAAVSELSLEVRPGRIYGLLGPNGAGKTTTIRMIVNIVAPDSGRIDVFGQQITPLLQDRIGYLPEERGLYKKMKVGEQIKFFAALK